MRKLLLVILAAVLIVSCQKKEVETAPATRDVSFKAIEITPDLKSTADWECKDEVATHAWVKINGDDYYPALFELDDVLYTQAIKLPVIEGQGDYPYCVETFVLYYEGNNTEGYQNNSDDVIVFGTPVEDNDPTQGYDIYVQWPLEYCFNVEAFTKDEIPIEVLCFQDAYYTEFGYDWFAITEIVVREFCFFGDICLNGDPYSPADYEGSLYGTGLGVDVPAIMKIVVKKGGVEVPYSPFDNEATLGIGEPLCVQYPDNLSAQGEEFTFELWIWTPDCNGDFHYEYFDTYTSIDDGPLDIPVGTDNVLDFVVGTCNYSDADATYAHFEWLVLKDLWDETNTNGFLFTSDPSAGAIWKWERTSTGAAANITEPMAYYLNKAGFPEIAEVAFDAIWHDLDLANRFWSTSPSGLMGGYVMTGDSKFKTMANSIFSAWAVKYHYSGAGAPRAGLWGYDCINILRSSQAAAANGVIGAPAHLADMTTYYNNNYVANALASDYDRIFINAIAVELGIGSFQGAVTWNDTEYGLQEAAYGLIGGSWSNPDVVKAYIIANICTATYSEPVAEAVYALGL